MRDNKRQSVPVSGMNRDSNQSFMGDQEYSFALNANTEGAYGDRPSLQNEPSNIKCLNFEDFKVVGFKNDVADGVIYLFLNNPKTRESRFVYFRSKDHTDLLIDLKIGEKVGIYRAINERLESTPLVYEQVCDDYEILLRDDATVDFCLNFSIEHPIYDIIIKSEQCGKSIYWTDGYNPPRYFDFNRFNEDPNWYSYKGEIICGDRTNIEYVICNCERLRIFPLIEVPSIQVESIQTGGSLRSGTYEFAVAACDKNGNEISNYSAITCPTPIFDNQNMTIKDGVWGANTGYGIRLKVSNVDTRVSHFKIAVIQSNVGSDGAQQYVESYFIEGVHPRTEQTIYYLSDKDLPPTTKEHIYARRPIYNTSDGMTTYENKLIQYGVTAENDWNLQPMVNLLGATIKWQTGFASEDLYKDGAACAKYASVMRDEVYPYSIRFVTNTGYRSKCFICVPPPATGNQNDNIYINGESGDLHEWANNDDVLSILENNPPCAGDIRNRRWQYYDTSNGYLIDGDDVNINMVCSERGKSTFVSTRYSVLKDFYTGSNEVWVINGEFRLPIDPVPVLNSVINDACDNKANYLGGFCLKKNESTKEWADNNIPFFPGDCSDTKYVQSLDNFIIRRGEIKDYSLSIIYRPLSDYTPFKADGIIIDDAMESMDIMAKILFGSKNAGIIEYNKNVVPDWNDHIGEGEFTGVRPGVCSPSSMLDKLLRCYLLTASRGNSRYSSPSMAMNNAWVEELSWSDVFYFERVVNESDVEIFNQPGRFSALDTQDTVHRSYYGHSWDFGGVRAGCVQHLFWLMCNHVKGLTKTQSFDLSGRERCLLGIFATIANTGIEIDFEYSKYESLLYSNDFDTGIGGDVIKRSSFVGGGFTPPESSDPCMEYHTYCDEAIAQNGTIRSHKGASLHWTPKRLVKNAKWYKLSRPRDWGPDDDINEASFVFMIGGASPNQKSFLSNSYDVSFTDEVRVTFWGDENGTLYRNLLSESSGRSGVFVPYEKQHHILISYESFVDDDGTLLDDIYISVDTGLCALGWTHTSLSCNIWQGGIGITTSITKGGYLVGFRRKQVDGFSIKMGSISVDKEHGFESSCISCSDEVNSCDVAPYMKGDFSYWESTEKYPTNNDLYDSSKFVVTSDFVNSELGKYYSKNGAIIDGRDGYSYDLNLCGANIRHYKFPSNRVSPFMKTEPMSSNAKSVIFPMGVFVDKRVVNELLDDCVRNKMITQEQRDSITGFEILRGNRAIHKSVIATGLGFDMWKYKDDSGRDTFYPNYPYNDLNDDQFLMSDKNGSVQSHPFGGEGNNKFSFISPDLLFDRPLLSKEISIDGYQYGVSSGSFQDVENHPKWVVLGGDLYQKAISYASKEANSKFVAGLMSFDFQPIDKGRMVNMWIDTFINNGIRKNFAYYYSSYGYYNYFSSDVPVGSALRGLIRSDYLLPGRFSFGHSGEGGTLSSDGKYYDTTGNILVNNLHREDSVFISCGAHEDSLVVYPNAFRKFDKSRVLDACVETIGYDDDFDRDRPIIESNISSPYLKMKVFNPSQYGGIDDIVWSSTGVNYRLDDDNGEYVYGGDIFISRVSVKRKFPYFYTNAFNIGNSTPFHYMEYRNVAYPRYYMNFESHEESGGSSDDYWMYRKSKYVLACESLGRNYIFGRFYLFSYGHPQFLVESPMNYNFRLKGLNVNETFYPESGDFAHSTQESRCSITLRDNYFINKVYERRSIAPKDILPSDYSKEINDCENQLPEGFIWSEPDTSNVVGLDPWLVYKPMNRFSFRSENGRLIKMVGIESGMVLALFENRSIVGNYIDTLKDRLNPIAVAELGEGGVFAERPLEFNKTDIGFAGTQGKAFISNDFGHFWVDAKRGTVIRISPNAQSLESITEGVRNWMINNLPFKLLRYEIINDETQKSIVPTELDNQFTGVGIVMGWDNRHKRLFITKRDYIPVHPANNYRYKRGKFYWRNPDQSRTEISVLNEDYFVDASFTIAFNCETQKWISYYSFKPDYYINHGDYFQTGLNFSTDEREQGLWSHLLVNQSYQVFYGKLYPFIVENTYSTQYVNKIISNVQYRLESRLYSNDVDFSVNRLVGFNKAIIYSNNVNSGELRLIPEDKNNYYQQAFYPAIHGSYTEIIATEIDGKWNINDFYNRVRDDLSGTPHWIVDVNDIERDVNPNAIINTGEYLDRLRSDWYRVRFINDVDSRYHMVFRFGTTDEKIIDNG